MYPKFFSFSEPVKIILYQIIYSKNPTIPCFSGGMQNGTVLRKHDIRGAGIGCFTVHRKNGGNNGGTVFGGHGIRVFFKFFFFKFFYLFFFLFGGFTVYEIGTNCSINNGCIPGIQFLL